MAGLLYQQPVQGWGVGHQGERIFNTAPAYNSIPYPMGNGGREGISSPDSLFDESDDELDPYDAIYGELDLQKVYGQQLAIWTHRNPESICLFTPIPGDTFMNIVAFARTSMQFNTAVDKMMVLLPGHKRPLDMGSVFIVKPGTAIIIAPLYDYVVSVEIKQLGHKIDMVVHVTMTVWELKCRLQTERGYPADRMDLLYKDKPMENSRYLFEYGLAHSTTLFALLMLRNDILVHIETFWGKQYHLYIDSCTTGFGIIASILRRTVSQNVVDVVRLYELFLPKHTLVLYLGSRVVDWDNCLGFYGIEDGNVLRMSTIGLAHEMDLQKVPIVLDNGRPQQILASKFDRWSTIVLKLHGMTGYPVNLMRLVKHKNVTVDFSDTIGAISKGSEPVILDVSSIKTDDDLMFGIPLRFKIARGITELLKVAPNRTIKSVKDTLERIGVPNAGMYDLVMEGYRLPNNKRVVDVIDEYRVPIELSLRQYPVFIHGTQNVIYKMLAYSKETLATFLMRVKMKTALSFKDYLLLSCGDVLDDDESMPVFETRLTVKSSVFLIPRKQYRSFFILHDDWLSKVRIPAHPKVQQIKDILWKERNVPEGGLASIGNFMQWYFAAQNRETEVDTGIPLKERMAVYEANIGDKYMQLRVEPPRAKNNRHKGKNYKEADLNDLKHSDAKQKKKQRALSMPPVQRPRGRAALPHIPRHMSADNTNRHGGGRNGHVKRKAYTTLPAPKPRRHRHEERRRAAAAAPREANGMIPPPVYKYTDGDGRGGDEADANKEWVLVLRHDYTVNTTKGRRRATHH